MEKAVLNLGRPVLAEPGSPSPARRSVVTLALPIFRCRPEAKRQGVQSETAKRTLARLALGFLKRVK